MIPVTENYRLACKSPIRNSYFLLKYGLYDKKAKSKINMVTMPNAQAFSNPNQTFDEIKTNVLDYISCEPNRVRLNDTFTFIQDKNTIATTQNVGYWSKELSNENGTFTDNPYLIYYFNNEIGFADLTLYFQDVVSDFKVYYYLTSGGTDKLVVTRSVQNNTELIVQTNDEITITGAIKFNKIKIEFIKTLDPYRFIKFEEVDFGIYRTFTYDEIETIDIIEEFSIDSSELSSNSMNITIKDYNNEYNVLNTNNKLSLLQERQEITAYYYLKVGLNFKEISLGTYLLKNIETGAQELKLECYDDTYFMNKTYYGSLFYKNEKMSKILQDIFTYFNYTNYELASELDNIRLTGYIPGVEMKEAIRLVAEAGQCVVVKNRYGITRIFKNFDNSVKLFTTSEYEDMVATKNLYDTVIETIEYNYTDGTEEVELYNDTLEKAGTYNILFNSVPLMYEKYKDNFNALKGTIENVENNYTITSLSATGCTIVTRYDNQQVLLKGYVYTENKKTIRKSKNADVIADESTINTIDNCLITANNSNNVVDWKLSRSDIKYNFNCLLTPYIENGDKCKIQIPFKDKNGNYVRKEFIPTNLTFSNSIRQSIEGE